MANQYRQFDTVEAGNPEPAERVRHIGLESCCRRRIRDRVHGVFPGIQE